MNFVLTLVIFFSVIRYTVFTKYFLTSDLKNILTPGKIFYRLSSIIMVVVSFSNIFQKRALVEPSALKGETGSARCSHRGLLETQLRKETEFLESRFPCVGPTVSCTVCQEYGEFARLFSMFVIETHRKLLLKLGSG